MGQSSSLTVVDLKLTKVLLVLVVIEFETGITATLNPLQGDVATAVDFALQLGVLRADLVDGVSGGHIALLPPLCHALLFFVQLADILDGTLQNGTLVFVAVRDKLSDLVDALVDGLATTTLNYETLERIRRQRSKCKCAISYPPCDCFYELYATRVSQRSAFGSCSEPPGQHKLQPQSSVGRG